MPTKLENFHGYVWYKCAISDRYLCQECLEMASGCANSDGLFLISGFLSPPSTAEVEPQRQWNHAITPRYCQFYEPGGIGSKQKWWVLTVCSTDFVWIWAGKVAIQRCGWRSVGQIPPFWIGNRLAVAVGGVHPSLFMCTLHGTCQT